MIHLAPCLDASRSVDLRSTAKRDAVAELCRVLAGSAAVTDPADLERAVLEREAVLSTGVGLGIAVPHAKIPSMREFAVALGRSATGIEWDSLDGRPVHLVVLIAGPEDRQARYLQILSAVTLRLKRAEVRAALRAAKDAGEMAGILASA